MMLKFFEYFRVAGTLSVLVWIGAAYALAYSRRSARHRWRWLLGSLAAAVAAWNLAQVASDAIMDARIDDRDQVKAVLAANDRMTEDSEGEAQMTARFAEDGAGDRTSLNGVTAAEVPDGVPSLGGGTAEGGAAGEPEYRKGGKKTRSTGKKLEGKEAVDIKLEEVVIRYMKAEDLAAAKLLDTLNRLIAGLILLASAGLIAWDYLRAFNATRTTRWLAPIGGRWLDALSPRTRLVLVTPQAAAGRLSPVDYAESVLRKGEQVLHFGLQDPWAGCERLTRFAVGSRTVWGIRKLAAGGPDVPPGTEFLLDGAWFGRYAVAGAAPAALAEVVDLLWQRYETGASARRTVHLVWSAAELPAGHVLASLRRIAVDTNVKLIAWTGANTVPAELRGCYDEVCDQPPEREQACGRRC